MMSDCGQEMENVTRSSLGHYSHFGGYHLKGFQVFWAVLEGSLRPAQIPPPITNAKIEKVFHGDEADCWVELTGF
jgi:hypothetical protein